MDPLEPDDAGPSAFSPNMFVENEKTWVFEEGLKAFFSKLQYFKIFFYIKNLQIRKKTPDQYIKMLLG